MMLYMLGIDGLSPQGFVRLLCMSLPVRAPELRPRVGCYQRRLLPSCVCLSQPVGAVQSHARDLKWECDVSSVRRVRVFVRNNPLFHPLPSRTFQDLPGPGAEKKRTEELVPTGHSPGLRLRGDGRTSACWPVAGVRVTPPALCAAY